MFNGSYAAAGDNLTPRNREHLLQSSKVRPRKHSVGSDIGKDRRTDPSPIDLPNKFEGVQFTNLRPTFGRDFSSFGVNAHGYLVSAKLCHQVVQRASILNCAS